MAVDVSIVVSCAAPGRAGASLMSALAQEGPSVEAVVVGGGSGELPGQENPRVRYVPADPATSEATRGNRGLALAQGEWLALLREGDLWAPDHLARTIGGCEQAGADLGYAAAWVVDPAARIVGYDPAPPPRELAAELLAGRALRSSSVVLARRSVWERAGGLDTWFDSFAVWDLLIRWTRGATDLWASDVPTCAIAEAEPALLGRNVLKPELRELRRRYGRDARAAGVRLGADLGRAARGSRASSDAHVPWLTSVPRPRVGRR